MSLNPENVRSGAAAGQKTPVTGTCPVCGRPLTQLGPNGECLRCLFNWALEGEQTGEKSTEPAKLAPTQSRYAHFEVEVSNDGFPAILGAGAMAVTYCARDTVLNSKVALKVISGKLAENPTARARFLREARSAAQIQHPNVARVIHYGEQGGECFYAMQLVRGETLEARVQRDGRIPLAPALEIIEQTARGLVAGEACGVVHRDLKPSNIMIESDPSGQLIVKIIDFGVAKVMAGDNITVQTQAEFVGTPAFASPEQFDEAGKQHIDTRSDIYSLGVTFCYLLTGRTPFDGRSIEEIRAKQTKQLSLETLKAVHAPASVIALLRSMLALDPAKRPQTARDLLSAIHRCHIKFSAEGRSLHRLRFALTGIGAALVLAIAVGTWSYRQMRSSAPVTALPLINEKSIAVLPFENRSEDKSNAYFAEGIQDEILVRLSKIADLKVISRSSTEHYKSTPENLPEIAKALGVAHILEGSVQKTGDSVRVNVQLIKAANDSHVWAESFDRKLNDIFSVESEVAKTIADQLRAKLTGEEEQIIAAKPTDNTEAYDNYLRGLAYSLKPLVPANQLGAQKYLKEAVRLDPKFALAWALLSLVDARGYLTAILPPTVALREEAQQAAQTALTLQPKLGEAVLANGHYYYSCLKDYDTAVRWFEQARPLLPNSSRIPELLAYVTRRRGHWDRSEGYFNEAERLDPRNVQLLAQHTLLYNQLRRFPEALRKLDQVLDITPDEVDRIAIKAAIAQAEGDLPQASAVLAPLRPNADLIQALETQIYQAILERRPAQIIPRLKEILAKPDPALGFYNGELRFWLGWADEVAGNHAAAQESWRQASDELESFFKEQPGNFQLIGDLALTNMSLGDKAGAFALIEKGMAAAPIDKDASAGTRPIEILSRVAAQMKEPDRAIAALEKLLSIPGQGALGENVPLTPALLKLDPMFDPLRKDPRFQELLTSSPPTPLISEKSIAVLPFENRSEDKSNAYFAEGIQDEILVRLSKIADLKVISRTSTEHYKSNPGNVPEVAKQLGVAYILEGSVQKSGDAVRVTVQLIKGASDSHLWADSFDRKLTDIFWVESEVAKAIADQLRAKLTGEEEQIIAAKPTDNPDAYDAYLRGLAYDLRPDTSANAFRAQSFLREAVRLDPKFALAWALLSGVESRSYRAGSLPQTLALREDARQSAETALTLQPRLGEAVWAEGYYYYSCLKDYDTAVRYFEEARQFLPNSSRIPESLAYVSRRRGDWDRSESYFKEAERVDPRNVSVLAQHELSYCGLRRFPEALRKLDQILDITPDDMDAIATKAAIAQAEGDLPRAAELLAPLHPNADEIDSLVTQLYQTILERCPGPVIAQVKEMLAKPGPGLACRNGELRFWFGWAQELAGDHAAATESWRHAQRELKPCLEEQPESQSLMAYLALTNVRLGEKVSALALAERMMTVTPLDKDALAGPGSIETFVRVAAQAGEPDRAIAALQKLMSIPACSGLATDMPPTAALLKLDPMFDPLRKDPRFQKLLASPPPKR